MVTIIQSGSKAWAIAATNGDVRIFSREQVGEWTEVLLSEDSEQIDGDGSLILEALYEQHAGTAPEEAQEPEAAEEEEEPAGGFNPVVVAEGTEELKSLSVASAVAELDLTGVGVVVFQHAGSGRVNIVYRRRDGAIGWLDPQAPRISPRAD